MTPAHSRALDQANALIAAATAWRDRIAAHGLETVEDSYAGMALVNAMYDVTDVAALYDLAQDIERVFADDPDAIERAALREEEADRRFYEALVS